MAEKFDLFRLSLLPRQQTEMFEPSLESTTREDWIRKVFSENLGFLSYGTQFHFRPETDASRPDALIGRIGRHISQPESKPPEEGFEEYTHEAWQAAVLVIDPRHHDDGQKLACENFLPVGKPSSLVPWIINAINERYPRAPYQIEANPIMRPGSFWDFERKNHGAITAINFDFIVPNMFGGDDDYNAEMREYRDREKARRVSVSLKNPDGLAADTERMQRAVEYAAKGGGSITARAKKNQRYNSKNKTKRSIVKGLRDAGLAVVDSAKELADRILGREQDDS